MVAFQCRKVWKVIRSSRGLLSFLPRRFFASVKVAATYPDENGYIDIEYGMHEKISSKGN